MLSLPDFMLLSIYGQKNAVIVSLLQQIRESNNLGPLQYKKWEFGSESNLSFSHRENLVFVGWMNERMNE